MLFGDHTPESKFHSDYAMCEMPEAAFLSWLQDPDHRLCFFKSNEQRPHFLAYGNRQGSVSGCQPPLEIVSGRLA